MIVTRARGFTLAEVLTVIVIVGIVMAVIAATAPLALRAPAQASSQVDSVQSAALALYRVQRDLRQSNTNAIFNCSLPPLVLCTQPQGNTPISTPALVLVTADDGTGQFTVTAGGQAAGAPKWRGFLVYWLTPTSDGLSNKLERQFYPSAISVDPVTGTPLVSIAAAASILTAAVVAPAPVTVAQDVRSLSASIDATTNIVNLRVDAGDLKGNVSSLMLSGNSYVRN